MEDSGKKQVSGKNGSRKIDSKLVTNYESRATQIDLDIQRIREDMKQKYSQAMLQIDAKIEEKIMLGEETIDLEKRELIDAKQQAEKLSQKIHRDRELWEAEKRQISKISNPEDEIIDLDVGGVTEGFRVRKSLLTSVPGSALEAMFSGRHELKKVNGRVFIDRDADVFKMVISYLRNGKRIHAIADESLKERFEMELDYWNLDEEQKQKKLRAEKIIDMQAIYDKEPTGVNQNILKLWKKLGPLKLTKIIEENKLEFNENLNVSVIPKKLQYKQLQGDANLYGQNEMLKNTVGFVRVEHNCSLYEGQVLNQNPNGFGRQIDELGYCEGHFKNGFPHGYGKLIWNDGVIQEGRWEKGYFKGPS